MDAFQRTDFGPADIKSKNNNLLSIKLRFSCKNIYSTYSFRPEKNSYTFFIAQKAFTDKISGEVGYAGIIKYKPFDIIR